MGTNDLSKTELEFLISVYEMLFVEINNCNTKKQLLEHISGKINLYDKQLIALINKQNNR